MVSIGSPGTSRIRKNAKSVIPTKVGTTRLTRVRTKRSIEERLRRGPARRNNRVAHRAAGEIGPARVGGLGQVLAGREFRREGAASACGRAASSPRPMFHVKHFFLRAARQHPTMTGENPDDDARKSRR